VKDVFAALLFLALFLLEIFLGSLSLWSFQNMIGSRPLGSLQRLFQKSLWLVLPLALLFLVLGFGIHSLFPWAQTGELKGFRGFYLNPVSFYLRTVIYFLCWGYWTYRILQQKTIKAPLVLIVSGLTATFASIDWILSLDPTYRSSAFGLVFFLSSSLLAFAFHLRRAPASIPSEDLIRLNNVHLALIGSWAYVAFMEFLIVWYGNTPAETSWFVPRVLTTWKFLSIAVILLQFTLPVFLLFFRAFKKSILFTRSLATLTVVMQVVYLLWQVAPSLERTGLQLSFAMGVAVVIALMTPFVLPRWVR
jgi:hypothetical protein